MWQNAGTSIFKQTLFVALECEFGGFSCQRQQSTSAGFLSAEAREYQVVKLAKFSKLLLCIINTMSCAPYNIS
jgi:hypothetical protein